MLDNGDCIQEVKEMCLDQWTPDEIARGEYWMEINWKKAESENRFMIIYGKENIETVSRLLVRRIS